MTQALLLPERANLKTWRVRESHNHVSMDRNRAPYFSVEEQRIILEKYEEFRGTFKAKSNTVGAAKERKACWQRIADSVNAYSANGVKRTWTQVKTKYKNIVQTANRKRGSVRQRGGGLLQNTLVEELTLSNNEGSPLITGFQGMDATYLDPHSTMEIQSETKVDEESLSICSEIKTEEVNPVSFPHAGPSVSAPTSRMMESESVKTLYKRTLELDIIYKELLIKKVKLEIERLEDEKRLENYMMMESARWVHGGNLIAGYF
ncbi:myb/SANT-like DNA-binding domain-containing protein 4 isoform X3 [Brienomyrus brachyistius]|uniref:myb/SANT-like DNA-binding domain-containing protein 4 isoform X3 n=1 Tax=Brienomyrus brachyistius TaxID=42636 RepID=UPI0020B45ECF|nr:myb/SANT-like DNA-binding domain-containing protein 4 isoform X3 [Brienomyrus brachyistius]